MCGALNSIYGQEQKLIYLQGKDFFQAHLELLSCLELYQYQNFQNILYQFDEYEDFVIAVNNRMDRDAIFVQHLLKTQSYYGENLYYFFRNEALRIKQLQESRRINDLRFAAIKNIDQTRDFLKSVLVDSEKYIAQLEHKKLTPEIAEHLKEINELRRIAKNSLSVMEQLGAQKAINYLDNEINKLNPEVVNLQGLAKDIKKINNLLAKDELHIYQKPLPPQETTKDGVIIYTAINTMEDVKEKIRRLSSSVSESISFSADTMYDSAKEAIAYIPDWRSCYAQDTLDTAQKIMELPPEKLNDCINEFLLDDKPLLQNIPWINPTTYSDCAYAQHLYHNGFKETGLYLASFSLGTSRLQNTLIEGLAQGGISSYEGMYHTVVHPIDTIKNFEEACFMLLVYSSKRQNLVESRTIYGPLSKEGQAEINALLADDKLTPLELQSKKFCHNLRDRIYDSILNPSLQGVVYGSGHLLGGLLACHYNPITIANQINKASGLGIKTASLLDNYASQLANDSGRLKLALEMLEAPVEITKEIFEVAQKGNKTEVREKLSAALSNHCEHVAIIHKSIAPSMVAQEIKTFTIAGRQTDRLLNEIGQVIGKNGVPQGGHIIRYRKDLGRALNEVFKGEMAAPLEAVDTLMIRSYESILARQKTGLVVDQFANFAREVGEINLKRIKNGQAIDYSKYLLTQQEKSILEQAVKSFKDIPGAMGKDGPLTRIIKCGVEGDCGNHIVSGSLYEVQEALQIEKIAPGSVKRFNVKETEIIEIFGKQVKKVEFDIMTKDTFIECKNTHWKEFKELSLLSKVESNNINKLIQKLSNSQTTAQGLGFKYELYSNHRIPLEWKNILNEKNIKFIDRSCGNCNLCT